MHFVLCCLVSVPASLSLSLCLSLSLSLSMSLFFFSLSLPLSLSLSLRLSVEPVTKERQREDKNTGVLGKILGSDVALRWEMGLKQEMAEKWLAKWPAAIFLGGGLRKTLCRKTSA